MMCSSGRKQFLSTCSFRLLLLNLFVQPALCFVVPQELPSLLSVVYSNIPVIKKGTDSRLGFGFRLGEHADFQVLVELGPQTETRPLGEPNKDDQGFSKRQVSAEEQRQQLRKRLEEKNRQALLSSNERAAAMWLETWSQDINNANKKQLTADKNKHKSAEVAKPMELPTSASTMRPETVQQLQLLYKMATSSTESSASSTAPNTTTGMPNENIPFTVDNAVNIKLATPAL